MASWYVSDSLGIDTNPGSIGSPFQTIGKAVTVAGPGDSILLYRGDTFDEHPSVFEDFIYWGAYGSGANPIISPVSSPASNCFQDLGVFSDNVVEDIDFTGGNKGVYLTDGFTITFRRCNFYNNSDNGVGTDKSVAGGGGGASGTALFEDCTAYANGNDGFSCFDACTFTYRRCVSHSHVAAAPASDGFTNHDSCVTVYEDCEAYGNTKGWSLVSNASGCKLLRCWSHGNSLKQFSLAPTTGVITTPLEIVGGLFSFEQNAVNADDGCIQIGSGGRAYLYGVSMWNGNAGAVTNHCLYINTTGTAAGGYVGWKNCRFDGANDNECRYVRTSIAAVGGVRTQVKFCSGNRYGQNTGNKWNDPSSVSFTTWKTGMTDLDGAAIDGSSTQGAETLPGPWASKVAARITPTHACYNAGVAIPAGADYKDIFGVPFNQSGGYDIGCHEYVSAGGFGAGGFQGFWSA